MKIRKTNRSLSWGQKCIFPAIALGLSLAMAAPAFGAVAVQSGDWNTGATWGGSVPSAEKTEIGGGFSVTLDDVVPSIANLEIYGGATLTQTGGSLTFDNAIIGDGGSGTFEISGGTFQFADDAIILGPARHVYSQW